MDRQTAEPGKDRKITPPPAGAQPAQTVEGGPAGALLGLQRSAGNRLVNQMVSRGAAPVIRRTLAKEANEALTLAVTRAGDRTTRVTESNFLEEEHFTYRGDITYGQAKSIVDRKVPTKQQKEVIDVGGGGLFAKKNDEAANVRKLVQAYLLKGLAKPVEKLDTHPQRPAEPEKVPKWEKAKLEQYAKKSLVVRDQYKPLVKMKPTSPEVQAFLDTEGFNDPDLEAPQTDTKEKGHKGPRIEVRASFSGKAGSKFPMRIHLFIVYTAMDGKQWYIRGGPGEEVDDPEFGRLDSGYVTAEVGRFTSSSIDYDPSAHSVTVMKGPEASDRFDAMVAAAERVNAARVPYQAQVGGTISMAGENCNAAAWTILNKAGVPTKKPSGIHPGWGKPLGRQTWDHLRKKNKKAIAKGEMTLPEERGTGDLKEFGELTTDLERMQVVAGGAKLFKDRLGADVMAMLAEGEEVDVLRTAGGTALVREADGKRRTGYMLISKLGGDEEDESVSDDTDDEEEFEPRPATIAPGGNALMFDRDSRNLGNWFDPGQDIEVIDDDYAPGKDGLFRVRGRVLGGALEEAYIFGNRIQLKDVGDVEDDVPDTDPHVLAGATHRIVEGGADSSGDYGSVSDEIAGGTPVKLAEGFEGHHEGWEKVMVEFMLEGRKQYGYVFFDKLTAL